MGERPVGAPVTVRGVPLRRGTRVRLRPSRRADIFDLALDGRVAEVDGVEEDVEGRLHVAVTVDADPGRDLGAEGRIAHRFFFSPDELEPLAPGQASEGPARILVAGIGNVFMADDAFGPEVVGALRARGLPAGALLADFGIRGMDLAYRLLDGFEAAVLIDAMPRGGRPGDLYVVEPEIEPGQAAPEAHAMDPVRVLALARELGGSLPRTLVVGCEPQVRMSGDEPDVVVGLSDPVRRAVDGAVRLVESLVTRLLDAPERPLDRPVPAAADPMPGGR